MLILFASNRYTSYTYSGLTVTPTAEVKSGAALGWTFPDTTDSDTVWQVSVTGTYCTAFPFEGRQLGYPATHHHSD
jgi:hypothetical protein